MTRSREFIDELLRGDFDDSLDVISSSIRERRKVVRRARDLSTLASVSVGDEGTLSGLSPKYLNGESVKVIGHKETKISVVLTGSTNPRMSRAFARFGTLPFTIPAGCFVKNEVAS